MLLGQRVEVLRVTPWPEPLSRHEPACPAPTCVRLVRGPSHVRRQVRRDVIPVRAPLPCRARVPGLADRALAGAISGLYVPAPIHSWLQPGLSRVPRRSKKSEPPLRFRENCCTLVKDTRRQRAVGSGATRQGGSCFIAGCMVRTYTYVDGFNVYNGGQQTEFKWLDPVKLASGESTVRLNRSTPECKSSLTSLQRLHRRGHFKRVGAGWSLRAGDPQFDGLRATQRSARLTGLVDRMAAGHRYPTARQEELGRSHRRIDAARDDGCEKRPIAIANSHFP